MGMNVLIKIEYDGTDFSGWQIQPDVRTVQGEIEHVLRYIAGEEVHIHGTSRTDAGVHALGQCATFEWNSNMPVAKLPEVMNRRFGAGGEGRSGAPGDIRIKSAEVMPDDFHARYSCKGKEYVYKVWNSRVRNPFLDKLALHYRYDFDVEALNKEAQAFVGTHDFTSFCTLDKREKGDFTRTVEYFRVEKNGSLVTFTVAADGFLYNMVRIMVGTLLAIGQGRIPYGSLKDIIEAQNRKAAGPTAPPHGLYLNKVFY